MHGSTNNHKISLSQYQGPIVCTVFVCADLRKCEERGELLLPVLFFLLVVLSVLLYFAVSLMDPGFVLTDTVKVQLTNKTHITKAKHTYSDVEVSERLFLIIYCTAEVTVKRASSQPAYKILLCFQLHHLSMIRQPMQ